MEQVITECHYYGIGPQIEELLYSGVFKARERLSSGRELSEWFNISRATTREAITMLELRGVLNVKQGSEIFFVDPTDKLNQKSLTPYSEIGPFEPLQACQVIESNATDSATSQISFNELQELKKITSLQESAIAVESDRFEDLGHRSHSIIAEAMQNRVLIKQTAELWRAVRIENLRWKKPNYKCLHEKHLHLQWLEDHRTIFLALQQKDSELARGASWRHLENSKNELIKILKQDASISDFDNFFFAR